MISTDLKMHRLFQKVIHKSDFWIPCFLIGSGVLFFADFLFTSGNFYFRDILNFHYPLHRLLITSFKNLEWPLWNPYVYLGQPMLANPNHVVFYPTNLLHFVLPFNYVFKLHFVLQPLLAGPGLYFLLRRLGITPVASLSGAIAYQYSGTVLSFLNLYSIVQTVALLPWISWAYVGALQLTNPRRILVFGALLSLQIITFEPLMLQCVALMLLSLAVVHFLEFGHYSAALRRLMIVTLGGGIFAVCVAAIQIFPTLELLHYSSRGAGYDFSFAGKWSLHPMDLVSALFPAFYGDPYQVSAAGAWGELLHAGRESYIVSYFIGTLTVVLSVFSFLHPKRKLVYPCVVLAAASIVLALGEHTPLYRWLFEHFRPFAMGRYPCKYFLLTTLVLSVLAALGFEVVYANLRSLSSRSEKTSVILLLASAAVVAGAIWILFWKLDPQSLESILKIGRFSLDANEKDMAGIASSLKRSFLISAVYLSAGIFLIGLSLFGTRQSLAGCLFLLLQAAELAPANLRLSPLISDRAIESISEVNQFLQQCGSKEMGRVMPIDFMRNIPIRKIYAPNGSIAWSSMVMKLRGLPMQGIMNGIQYSFCETVDNLNTQESDILFQKFMTLPSNASIPLLQKTNSNLVITQGKMTDARTRLIRTFETGTNLRLSVYAVNQTLPRAYVVSGVTPVRSHAEALAAFLDPGFAASRNVILEKLGNKGNLGDEAAGTAEIMDYRNSYVRCRVDVQEDGFLVLLDSWYPGWRAFVDGRKANLYRANYAFRAVPVAQGNHVVEFRYRPYSFYLGLIISLATIFSALLIIIIFSGRRQAVDAC